MPILEIKIEKYTREGVDGVTYLTNSKGLSLKQWKLTYLILLYNKDCYNILAFTFTLNLFKMKYSNYYFVVYMRG